MNRNQLRYFVSAAEHRSFTKAAEQYYISQTAVTQQIQQLEQTLGCELFDRSTRPVSLTSAGKSFLLDAKAILERMSRAQERVHDAATGLTGTLRVGYVRGYERSDLSVLMRHFHQKNGNVLISFYRCSTDVLAAGLLHQEYDIVFTWDSTNLRTQEGVTFQTVERLGSLSRSMRAIRSRSAASSRGKSCAGRTSYICRPTPRPIPTATPFSCSATPRRATSRTFSSARRTPKAS